MGAAASIVSQSFADLAAISDEKERLKGIQYIIFACTTRHTDFLVHGLHALVHLCLGASAMASAAQQLSLKQYIVDEGAVTPLIELCEHNKNISVLADATHALASLAFNDQARSKMMSEGAVKPLVKLVTDHAEHGAMEVASETSSDAVSATTVLINSLKALCVLAQHDGSRLQIVQVLCFLIKYPQNGAAGFLILFSIFCNIHRKAAFSCCCNCCDCPNSSAYLLTRVQLLQLYLKMMISALEWYSKGG
jgi:hypothetical protein